MQSVGLGNWRRFTACAEERVVEAISRGEVPGVAKTSGESGDIVLSANFRPDRRESGTQFSPSTAGGPKPADQGTGNHNLVLDNYIQVAGKNWDALARRMGIDPSDFSDALHAYKRYNLPNNDDNITINSRTGQGTFNGKLMDGAIHDFLP